MSEQFDDLARTVAMSTTRRSALTGLSALALGTLGIFSVKGNASAKNNNDCQKCKRKCKRNNRKPGKKHPKNCNNKCRNKCKNN